MRSLVVLLTLAVATTTNCAEIASRDLVADSEVAALPADGVSQRDDKFLSVFQIVKFNNDMCSASDGNMGVCFTEAECSAKGGVATGACASSFGVCCVFKANVCGNTVAQKVSYIESPNYPAAAPAGPCKYNVGKCDAGVCQYKIIFEDVMLSDPDMGDCSNDTLIISNVDPVSTALVPNPLCGTLSGHEIYVMVNSTTVDPMFTFNHVSGIAKWKIKIMQTQCTDTDNLAPEQCLTYNTGTTGTIMSFNNQGGNGEMINNHCYSHCIKYQEGLCDVSLSAGDFNLGADDFLTFGGVVSTGTSFGTMGSLLWNFTGPYVAPFCSGADGTAMNSGYSISYMLLPCQ